MVRGTVDPRVLWYALFSSALRVVVHFAALWFSIVTPLYCFRRKEVFCQATFYLVELFHQATFYLAELFRQATIYMAELYRQIAFL